MYHYSSSLEARPVWHGLQKHDTILQKGTDRKLGETASPKTREMGFLAWDCLLLNALTVGRKATETLNSYQLLVMQAEGLY